MNKTKNFALIWLFITLFLLGYNAYLWLEKRITLNTDILALLPSTERDPAVQQAFNHMVNAAQQQIVVLIGAKDWTDTLRATHAYTAVIKTRPDVLQFSNATSAQTQNDGLAFFAGSRLNLLTFTQQKALQTQAPQYWVDKALNQLYSPFSGPKFGAWQDDPFGLFTDWLQTRAQETPVRPRDGELYVQNQDRSYAVLLMNLRAPAFSMTAQKTVLPLLERAKSQAEQIVPQIEIIAAGVALFAADAGQEAHHEMSTIGTGSLLGIVLLMWLTFRSLKPILLIGLSIVVGCLGAFSVCELLFGQVHLLTLVFGASLIGVAQDYGIYFLCTRAGTEATTNSKQLLRILWPGLILTLTAALIGYLGLALTPFPGLRQMAVFSGAGLVFAWLSVVFWFPILVQPQTLKFTSFAKRYAALLNSWPRVQMNGVTIIVAILFCLFLIVGLTQLKVSDDIRALQKPSPILVNQQIKLSKLLDAPSPVQFYLVQGATPEMVLQREEALKLRLDPLIQQNVIRGYSALSNWIPSLQTQKENQQLVATKLLTTDGPLKALALKLDEDNAWVNTLRNHLLAATIPLTPDAFLKTAASRPWQYLWLGKVNNNYASIVALRGLNNYADLPLLKQAAAGMKGVQWVDKTQEISAVLTHYRQYMSGVLLAAYLAIYLLLFIRYRSAAWRVLTPPALASLATLALLGILGLPLQLFHILAFMLILGLGVDYGIFLQEQPHQPHTWLTVSLSATSALLSFGLLALSQTPPLHAFGLTMLIGMALVWFLAPGFRKI